MKRKLTVIKPLLRGTILLVAFALAGPAVAQTPPPPPPPPGSGTPPPPPTTKEQCFNNGWQAFKIFKNQGDCVSYVATKQKNPRGGK